jgi:hypothetical protein
MGSILAPDALVSASGRALVGGKLTARHPAIRVMFGHSCVRDGSPSNDRRVPRGVGVNPDFAPAARMSAASGASASRLRLVGVNLPVRLAASLVVPLASAGLGASMMPTMSAGPAPPTLDRSEPPPLTRHHERQAHAPEAPARKRPRDYPDNTDPHPESYGAANPDRIAHRLVNGRGLPSALVSAPSKSGVAGGKRRAVPAKHGV